MGEQTHIKYRLAILRKDEKMISIAERKINPKLIRVRLKTGREKWALLMFMVKEVRSLKRSKIAFGENYQYGCKALSQIEDFGFRKSKCKGTPCVSSGNNRCVDSSR